MLKKFRPNIKKRLSSPRKFQNPYFEEMDYSDISLSSTRQSQSYVYPDWFFLTTDQLVEQYIPEVNFKTNTKRKFERFLRKGAIQKELIVNVFKEFILQLSMPCSQNKLHNDQLDSRRDPYCYFSI